MPLNVFSYNIKYLKIPFNAISLLLSTLTPRFARAFADCLKHKIGRECIEIWKMCIDKGEKIDRGVPKNELEKSREWINMRS